MKRKIIFWVFIALLLAGGGIYYYNFYYAAGHNDPLKSKDKIVIKAVDLFSLYNHHEDSANRLYLDSVISVSGTIDNIALNEGRYTLTLVSGDSSGAVICEMDMIDNEKVKMLKSGSPVNVVGFCNGLLMDVQLDRCKLEE